MTYPTELTSRAVFELKMFERVSADTGAQLLAEVERLQQEVERLKQQERAEYERLKAKFDPEFKE